jgi:hypothetical protein
MSEQASAGTNHGIAEIGAMLENYVPRGEYESVLEALNAATEERDTHRTAAETHSGRLKELETKLRGKAAREAYDKAAEKLKINPKFREHAFKLAEIPANADEPDAAAIEAHVQKWLTANPDFVEQAPAAPERPKTLERNEFDSGRGRSVSPGSQRFQVTRKEMADAVWQRQHGADFNAASKAGLLDILD